MAFLRRLLLLSLALYLGAWGLRIYSRKYYLWLPDYIRWSVQQPILSGKPTHIFFFYVDHFEPGKHVERTRYWEMEYPRLAERHRDSAGRPAQHTWFYPGDGLNQENLSILQRLVAAGYGEVEFHLHHGNDTEDSARLKYQRAIDYFQKFGFLKTPDGRTRFAFAHGMNGLDNSSGPQFCGVNTELRLLRDLGCFANFSFATVWDEAQPSMVNSIYEAFDDDRAKSYNRGTPLRVGQVPLGDQLIFEGPLIFVPSLNPRWLFFYLEDASIHASIPVTEQRVDAWIRSNIHVAGRPDWVFVKVMGHGAASDAEMNESLGPHFDRALSYLERRYNDGVNYVLHYITAREAYNLVRAAAANQQGDPQQYLDWIIPPYVADQRPRLPHLVSVVP